MSNYNYKGYHLFSDIDDIELRSRNRGMVMSNIYEDNLADKEGNTTKGGALLLFGYMDNIPEGERKRAIAEFTKEMESRGYRNVS